MCFRYLHMTSLEVKEQVLSSVFDQGTLGPRNVMGFIAIGQLTRTEASVMNTYQVACPALLPKLHLTPMVTRQVPGALVYNVTPSIPSADQTKRGTAPIGPRTRNPTQPQLVF